MKKYGKRRARAEDILKSSSDKANEQWIDSHEGAGTLDFERLEEESPPQVYRMKSKGKD